MKVSIVTISFNQARFLEQALQSVFQQRYPNLEYIVVDPGSKDESRELIRKHAEKISTKVFEPDNGPADGLRKGFSHATGDILGFLNADDVLLPGAIARVIDCYRADPTLDVVYGHGYVIDENNRILRRIKTDPFDIRQFSYDCVTFVQPSMFFSKKAYEAVDGFNIQNRTCWDGELLARFGMKEMRFAQINEYLSAFRLYGSSITGSGRLDEQKRRDLDRIFVEIHGRPKAWHDRIWMVKARLVKWMRNPAGLTQHISDIVAPPRESLTIDSPE